MHPDFLPNRVLSDQKVKENIAPSFFNFRWGLLLKLFDLMQLRVQNEDLGLGRA